MVNNFAMQSYLGFWNRDLSWWKQISYAFLLLALGKGLLLLIVFGSIAGSSENLFISLGGVVFLPELFGAVWIGNLLASVPLPPWIWFPYLATINLGEAVLAVLTFRFVDWLSRAPERRYLKGLD